MVAFLFALCFVVLFSQNGVLEYLKLRRQIDIVDRSISKLEAENAVLRGQIERLKNDDKYLEDMAREKYGFIREGEKVYRIEK